MMPGTKGPGANPTESGFRAAEVDLSFGMVIEAGKCERRPSVWNFWRCSCKMRIAESKLGNLYWTIERESCRLLGVDPVLGKV